MTCRIFPHWHYPAMTSRIFGVLTVFTVFFIGYASSNETCIMEIQKKCAEPNQDLNEAGYLFSEQHENVKNNANLCRLLQKMTQCVAKLVYSCYDHYSQSINYYYHSPYGCVITEEDILAIQKIVNSHLNKETTTISTGESGNGRTTSENSDGVTTTLSNSKGETGTETSDRKDVTTQDGGYTVANKKGTKEQHKGDGSSAVCFTASTALMTVAVSWSILMTKMTLL